VGQRPAFELGENQVAPRANDIAQNADDVDLEVIQPVPLEDGPTRGHHARAQLVHWEEPGLRRQPDRKKEQKCEGDGKAAAHEGHDTGKPLKEQGCRAI
jgi:hypothetical protein